jgi:hypothetical protein
VIIPFYSIAYHNFMAETLNVIAQGFISGILGPNRLSTGHLDNATLHAGLELGMAWDVLDAFHLSSERPVLVGHGAN